MIDLHTHTFFSDGALVASELVRRAQVKGYKAIGLTDHVDSSNIDFVLPRIVKVSEDLNAYWDIKVIPGVEITHAPLEKIPELVRYARSNGAKIVIGHGETVSEPVIPGTNRRAIEAGVDILAHPGLISREDAELAGDKGVYLEITARKLHNAANRHVARAAREAGAKLVLNTDAHEEKDLITKKDAMHILKKAGLSKEEAEQVLQNSMKIAEKI